MHEHVHLTSEKSRPSINRRLKITGGIFILLLFTSFLPPLKVLNQSLIDYTKLIWWAVLLGFLIGGAIDYFVPDEFIFEMLGKRKKRTLLYALLAGLLMSTCSHGILALAIQLYKKGANVPAVITFLLASPWSNFAITILLFGFFGWNAFWFIGGALVIALVTGLVYMVLDKYELIEKAHKVSVKSDYTWDRVKNFNFTESMQGIGYGAVDLANMVLWWILIGVMAAAVIGAYVPHDTFLIFFAPTITGLFLTLAVATVIEVCSEGSAPIAFEIYKKVGVLGNPFVFLMAGVITDFTEIGLLWSNVGKRTAIWLPVVTIPQVLVAGLILNSFL